jgi:hypothetical protein
MSSYSPRPGRGGGEWPSANGSPSLRFSFAPAGAGKEKTRPITTGCACPPAAAALHPWLQSDAPLGLVISLVLHSNPHVSGTEHRCPDLSAPTLMGQRPAGMGSAVADLAPDGAPEYSHGWNEVKPVVGNVELFSPPRQGRRRVAEREWEPQPAILLRPCRGGEGKNATDHHGLRLSACGGRAPPVATARRPAGACAPPDCASQTIRPSTEVKKGSGGRKGVRNLLPRRPCGCCAQKIPDPFLITPS